MEVIDVASKEVKPSNKSLATNGANATNRSGNPDDFELPTNAKKPLRTGLLVLLFGFGGFVLWSALAPIDSGVPSVGNVALDGRRKAVQHQHGGVAKKILVKENDSVKEGDVLIRLDDSVPLATKSSVEAELRSVEAQIQFLQKMVGDLRSMTEEGFYPRNRLLEYDRQLAEALARRQGLVDRLSAARMELERSVIRSPATGKVMGVTITTEGGVIAGGEKIMEIVPDDEKLVVEATVEPHLIDQVLPGLDAEVRFSALNLRTTPVILGKVDWVSADKFQPPNDPIHPMGYYRARVIVSAEELKKLGNETIRPGMPADVIIKTGERTFLEYLIKPLTDRMATSLKER